MSEEATERYIIMQKVKCSLEDAYRLQDSMYRLFSLRMLSEKQFNKLLKRARQLRKEIDDLCNTEGED